MKEKDVGEEADQLEQDDSNIGGQHTNDQGEPGDGQNTPGCREISKGSRWCNVWFFCAQRFARDKFFHGPDFLVPPVRGRASAFASFTSLARPSPVKRRIASTSVGPASRSS